MLNASELRVKSIAELEALKREILKERFNLRMQQGAGKMPKNHLFSVARKNIARINTVIAEVRKNQIEEVRSAS